MSDFEEYFRKNNQRLLEFTGFPKYYIKATRRYRESLRLAYPTLVKGGKSVLDLGGFEMAFLSSALAESATGVSISADAPALKSGLGIDVHTFNIMDTPFPLEGREFDVVFFLETLEHLPPPTDMVMKRVRSLVKPDGVLVLSVPNMAFWQKRVKFFFFGRSPLKMGDERDPFGIYHHIRTYTYDECMTLLSRYGFRAQKCVSGNYESDFRRGWYNYPFHLVERTFPRLAHKLIFLATPIQH